MRIVQAIGRIFRSNTDHGIVVLVGQGLQRWLRSPQNRAYLPKLLQQQIQLGASLRENVDSGSTTFSDLVDAVLTGDANWDQMYREKIGQFGAGAAQSPPSWLVGLLKLERIANAMLWDGDYDGAVAGFSNLADKAVAQDKQLAAWYLHWEGLAQRLGGHGAKAVECFVRAANSASALGRPKVDDFGALLAGQKIVVTPQAEAVVKSLRDSPRAKHAKVQKILSKIELDLQYGSATNSAEEAIKLLGDLLGLDASRPDKSGRKTGPDVVWLYPSALEGAALELKTNKKEGSMYRKTEDIGQFHDHLQYLSNDERFQGYTFQQVIIGRHHQVAPEANPPDELHVVQLEEFRALRDRTVQLYDRVVQGSGRPLAEEVQHWLGLLGLDWPQCIGGLDSCLATDLQREPGDA